MTTHRDVIDRYMDGFRRSDHEQILGCLTDDVTWYLPGHADLSGKEAFDGEIENDAFEGRPTLTVDRYVEDDDTVVIVGEGDGLPAGCRPRSASPSATSSSSPATSSPASSPTWSR